MVGHQIRHGHHCSDWSRTMIVDVLPCQVHSDHREDRWIFTNNAEYYYKIVHYYYACIWIWINIYYIFLIPKLNTFFCGGCSWYEKKIPFFWLLTQNFLLSIAQFVVASGKHSHEWMIKQYSEYDLSSVGWHYLRRSVVLLTTECVPDFEKIFSQQDLIRWTLCNRYRLPNLPRNQYNYWSLPYNTVSVVSRSRSNSKAVAMFSSGNYFSASIKPFVSLCIFFHRNPLVTGWPPCRV